MELKLPKDFYNTTMIVYEQGKKERVYLLSEYIEFKEASRRPSDFLKKLEPMKALTVICPGSRFNPIDSTLEIFRYFGAKVRHAYQLTVFEVYKVEWPNEIKYSKKGGKK